MSLVDKYGDRGSGAGFTSMEGKNIQKYNMGWKEALRTVNERIRLDFRHKPIAVFSLVASEVSSYHGKFVQLLQGVRERRRSEA